MIIEESRHKFEEVQAEGHKYIAGGVVSLNRKVDPNIIFKEGKGSKIYDINGVEYIDYHAAFAPHLLGHNYPEVNEAVIKVIADNISLTGSGTNELEVSLAKLLCHIIPSLDLIQITNTGSEATAHAIRLSRAYTGKEHIILIVGGYNGWHNDVARVVLPSLEQLGPRIMGEYPFIPSSAGIPEAVKKKVHCVNFNDLESVEYILKKYPVACVLTEPVLQNIGVVLPKPGYLQGLITRKDETGTDDTDNRFNHMEDGSGAMEREQLSQLAGRQIQFINHLEKAMMRIENKTYGICRVTGKLIDKARLRAVPHATLSIEAKKVMNK